MLNEERIILMTKMASYEEGEGKKNIAIGRYFRSDYIALQVLKGVLCATIGFGIIFGMTKMASYEEGEGKKNIAIGRYFRSDYIALQVLKGVLCATIGFGIIFGLFLLYDFEGFMQEIYKMDLIAFAQRILFYYGIFVVVYGGICYGVCAYRYAKAKKSLKHYYQNLKKLNSLYNQQ